MPRAEGAVMIPPKHTAEVRGDEERGAHGPPTRDTLYVMSSRAGPCAVLCARTTWAPSITAALHAAIKGAISRCAGVAFIGDSNEDSEAIICRDGGARRMGRLQLLDPPHPEACAAAFAQEFDRGGVRIKFTGLAPLHPARPDAGKSLIARGEGAWLEPRRGRASSTPFPPVGQLPGPSPPRIDLEAIRASSRTGPGDLRRLPPISPQRMWRHALIAIARQARAVAHVFFSDSVSTRWRWASRCAGFWKNGRGAQPHHALDPAIWR